MARTPQILAIEPEFVKDVLIKNFKNFHGSDFIDMIDKDSDPIFGRNPFFLKGEEWKEKRAEITPAFTPSRVSIRSRVTQLTLHVQYTLYYTVYTCSLGRPRHITD